MSDQPNKGALVPKLEVVDAFIKNQTKELEIRAFELELKKQQDTNSLSFSKDALAAQERDRKHERECERGKQRDRYGLVALLGVLLAAVLLGAMYLNKDELAKELIKAMLYVAPSLLGGYALGKQAQKKKDDSQQELEEE